MMKRKKSNTR